MASITCKKIVLLGMITLIRSKGSQFQPFFGAQFKPTWGGQFHPTLGGQFGRHLHSWILYHELKCVKKEIMNENIINRFFCLLTVLILASTGYSQTAEEYFTTGKAKTDQLDYNGAIQQYTKAIEIDPGHLDAYYFRGSAKCELGDYKGAILDFTKAIELDPKDEYSYYWRGYSKLSSVDYKGALLDFTNAIKLNPEDKIFFYIRGISKSELGDLQGAISDFTKAIELDPEDKYAYYARGANKRKLDDYQGAILDYTKAIKIDPEYIDAIFNRGYTKFEVGDLQESIIDFTEVIELDPLDTIAYLNRGYSKSELGDYQGAILDFTKAIELNPGFADAYYYRGVNRDSLDDHNNAVLDYKKASELDSRYAKAASIGISYQMFNSLRTLGFSEKAREYADKLEQELNEEDAETDTSYAFYYLQLARFYMDINENILSENAFLKTLELTKKYYGKENIKYATTCIDLGYLYIESGNNKQAEWFCKEAKEIIVNNYGKKHPEYIRCINDLAFFYGKIDSLQMAKQWYLEAKETIQEYLGKENSRYAQSCDNLAAVYYALADYQNAETLYKEAQRIYKKLNGKEDPSYATSCNSLGMLYSSMGSYQKAETLYTEAKNIYETFYGKLDANYARCCNQLAALYVTIGKLAKTDKEKEDLFHKAEKLYIEALEIIKKLNGIMHSHYASICNNLGLVYLGLENYSKAESFLTEANKTFEHIYGKNHSEYAKSCVNLAELHKAKGDFQKAEQLLIEAGKIVENVDGKSHPIYIESINNLGSLYLLTNNVKKGEQPLLEAKKLHEQVFGKNNLEYTTICSNLAEFYFNTGNYQEAYLLLSEANNILENLSGKESLKYIQNSIQLAQFSKYTNKHQEAYALLIEAKEIIEGNYGTESNDYITVCHDLGQFYLENGYFDEAEPLLIESKEKYEQYYGKGDHNYAIYCQSLATLYQYLGDFQKAEWFYIESLVTFENIYESDTPIYSSFDYLSNHINLASLYIFIGESAKTISERESAFQKAENYFIKSIELMNKLLVESKKFMSELERDIFLRKKISYFFDVYYSFFLVDRKGDHNLTEIVYNNVVNLKGQLLKSSVAIRMAVLESGDPELISIYNTLISQRKLLANEYLTPIPERKNDINHLKESINMIEKELTRKCEIYQDFETSSTVQWDNVKNCLSPNEAAIEFVHFMYCDKKGRWTNNTFYYALVLKKDMIFPKAVYLFEENQLMRILNDQEHDINQTDFKKVTELYKDTQLFNLIWKPLDSLWQGIDNVYLAPTGLLHKVSFSAILQEDGSRLSDNFTISHLSSTASIAQKHDTLTDINDIAIFGGIQYEYDSLEVQRTIGPGTYESGLVTMRRKENKPWPYLTFSKNETNTIADLFRKHNISVEVYTDTLATEESFNELSIHSPDILHISTHGFYNPLPKESQYRNSDTLEILSSNDVYFYSEDPLMRSGLIFAGANYTWMGNSPIIGIEDGILSAYEISNMNLYNTKLVVTSACETALGDLQGNEGVFGMQRGFKMAGIDNMIITLWEVSAEHTKEFMISFYSNLINNKSIHDAFYLTQTEMKIKYDNPYWWAAFVLVE